MMSDKNIPNLCQLCNRPLVFGSNPSFFKIIFPDKDDPLYACKRCCTEYVQTDIHDEDPNLILIDSKQEAPKKEEPEEVPQKEVPQEKPPKEEKPAVEKKPERYIPPVTKEVLAKQKEEQRKKNEETFWSNLPL